MFRTFVVALAVTLPLAAQVTETAPVVRIDVVVTDASGGRVRGLSAADFEVTEGGEGRRIVGLDEYALDATAAPAVTDTRFVSLQAQATPTPPRRLVFLFDPSATPGDREAAKALSRPGDIVIMEDAANVNARVATAAAQLAPYPERKAIVVFGAITPEMVAFANRRGVELYDRTKLSEAALDLGSYYSLRVRANNPKALQVKTTRPLTVKALVAASTFDIEDAVLANHAAEPQTNDLRISVSAEPTVTVNDKLRVKLHVLIPIRNLGLAREGEEVTGGFDVYVSTANPRGSIASPAKQTHAIKWPAVALEKAGNRNMEYVVDVVIEPGISRISVGVLDHRSKKTGFQRIEVAG